MEAGTERFFFLANSKKSQTKFYSNCFRSVWSTRKTRWEQTHIDPFFLRGGYQAYFFGNINFEIEVAQQGPYMYQHFGEVLGPRRPTGSEPRPALIWAPGIAIWQAPILGRGVARSRLGAEVPKLHQNVGTCMGLVGQLLSQN